MLFSIYIPVYNAQRQLKGAVQSVLNQDFDDFELVIIDDGSTDGSWDIMQEFAMQDKRIVLKRQENKGVFLARLVGMSICKGDYVIALDADDQLKKGALSTLSHKIEKYTPDMIIYRAEKVKAGKHTAYPAIWEDDTLIDNREKVLEKLFFGGALNLLGTKVISSKCIKVKEIDQTYSYAMGEDNLISTYCVKNADRILYIQDVLYEYYLGYAGLTGRFHKQFYKWYKKRTEINHSIVNEQGFDKILYYDRLNCRLLTLAGNYSLYSPYAVTCNKDYIEGIRCVAQDEERFVLYKKYKNRLALKIRFPLWLIFGKHYRIMLLLRRVITPIERMLLRFG